MAHKPWITAGFVTACCSMGIVSKTSCIHFSAWCLWVSICMALTWSKLNFCVWFWWPIPSASNLLLSVMVRSCHACHKYYSLRLNFSSWQARFLCTTCAHEDTNLANCTTQWTIMTKNNTTCIACCPIDHLEFLQCNLCMCNFGWWKVARLLEMAMQC